MKTTLRTGPLLVTAALLVFATQAGAGPRFVLQVCDRHGNAMMPGDAEEPYQDWMEVHGFGAAAEFPETEAGSSLRVLPVQNDFIVHKRSGRSSPLLMEACLNHEVLPAVKIKYLGESGSVPAGSEPICVELNHVQITGFEFHLGGTDPVTGEPLPMEQISFNFSESTWIYREHNDDHEVVGESEVDLITFLATSDPGFDDDGDGIPNDEDGDDDNDGILDENELMGGTDPLFDDAAEDLDQDGHSNGDEDIAGTRMNDPTSYLGIERIIHRRNPAGMECLVVLPVVEGRHYRLLASPDLMMPKEAWMVLDEFEVPPGSPEEEMHLLVEGALLGAPQLFFHVDVRRINGAPGGEPPLPGGEPPLPGGEPLPPFPGDPLPPIAPL